MTAPGAGEQEPRFASSAPAGYQPPSYPVAPVASVPTSAPPEFSSFPPPFPPPFPPSFPPALEPEVDYAGAFPPEPELRGLHLQVWLAPALTAVGGIVAIIASVLTWATLRLVSKTLSAAPDPQDSERIKYNGLNLLEGRITLLVGVIALILGVLMMLRRSFPIAVAAAGAGGLLAALFALIAHPVDLSALARVFGSADDVAVHIPNGPGVWLALVGSAVILSGGLAAQRWRGEPAALVAADEQPEG